MSAEQNKQIVRRFYDEVVNAGNEAVIDGIMSMDFVEHNAPPDRPPGLEGFKQFLKSIAAAFPDLQVTVEDLFAEGDKVAARVTVRGTHQGTLMGDIPPTGTKATWTGIDIFQLNEGKIAARWNNRDLLGLMRQLGVVD